MNHAHLLISQSKKIALSDVIAEVKKSSSKWIKTKGNNYKHFHWQDGYGAFSVGQLQVKDVKKYIAEQKIKHHTRTFENEFRAFLKKYEIEYDERYIWD